ncbi:hypothetical protein BAE44_0024236 [Dichanthelium oligosanthes]|uniref:Uncharacterized protein n=1 Tax=Dichanthelium oligosanthes TaxID=888268 RepID=A0A1E5UPE5_9POAL|nr:hypothetical protein BAE44_0024236 [Dichanthelium oligosanthes]
MNEAVVSRILAEHQGVGRRFNAPPHILADDAATSTLDGWLRSPALDNLQELDFCFIPYTLPRPLMPHSVMRFSSTLRVADFTYCQFPDDAAHHLHFPNLQHLSLISVSISEDSLHTLLAGCPALDTFVLMYCYEILPKPLMPPSALHFSPTLRVARFGYCRFPDAASHQVHFPNLQCLMLKLVTISEGSFHTMLSGCPVLNSLILIHSSGFCQFRINSLKLKHVEIHFHRSHTEIRLEKFIVENAPCLEILHYHAPYEDNMNISIISAPKLKILTRLTDNISRLELGKTVLRGPRVIRMATAMHSVKVLALRLDNLSLYMTINFMKCFPCLEKLDIKTYVATEIENMRLDNSLDRIDFPDFHLKKLRIRNYSGKGSHLAFAKFFVFNSSVLESLVLDVDPDKKECYWWIENQRRKLQLEKRASIGCQIEFSSDDCSDYLSD